MATPRLNEDLLNEDLPFQHYTLKHRLIAWISMHLFDTSTYTVRHGLLKGMKRKGGARLGSLDVLIRYFDG